MRITEVVLALVLGAVRLILRSWLPSRSASSPASHHHHYRHFVMLPLLLSFITTDLSLRHCLSACLPISHRSSSR